MKDRESEFYRHLELLVKDELERRLEVERKQKEQEKLLIQQSKMAAMGELLSIIAHQWKQPLSIISIITNLMEMHIREKSEMSKEEQLKYIKEIQEQVKFMSETLNDFKQFFKPSKSRKEFLLIDAINDTLKLINKQLQVEGVRLDIKDNSNNVAIYGFKSELIHVLINILNNALDVMKEREVEEKRISIELYCDNNDAVIEIEDSGGGIEKDVVEKIFEPYFTTKGDKGTGIGLSLCKLIITDHFSGSIYVKNGQYGARFIIKIPIYKIA